MKNATSIIITHGSTLFREGLTQLLRGSRFGPVHTAADFDETSERIASSTRSCLWLMDLRDEASFDTLRQVKATFSGVAVVVLAERQHLDSVLQALEAGASGFLHCDINREHLITALELIALGEMVVPAQFLQVAGKRLAGKLIHHEPQALNAASIAPCAVSEVAVATAEPSLVLLSTGIVKQLSGREMSILRMLVEGASNKLIAKRLTITEASVKVHNKAILRKLRLKNRTQAAVWAQNHFAQTNGGTMTSTANHSSCETILKNGGYSAGA
jgi:two-component system nitrate/nitrite response regulator NarL